jgi:hypothetical protein
LSESVSNGFLSSCSAGVSELLFLASSSKCSEAGAGGGSGLIGHGGSVFELA